VADARIWLICGLMVRHQIEARCPITGIMPRGALAPPPFGTASGLAAVSAFGGVAGDAAARRKADNFGEAALAWN
jgi:hypothetical protein